MPGLLLTGDAANTDPACALSPEHDKLLAMRCIESQAEAPAFVYRNFANALSPSHVASSAGAHRRKSQSSRGETEMDVRAAVAFEAGKPLSVETVQLEGPRAAKSWLSSRRRASATPTSSPCPERTRKACFRRSWGTRAPASSSTWAKA